MKRVDRLVIDSLCVLLVMEMLAACSNSEPDINTEALLQRSRDKADSSAQGKRARKLTQAHQRKAIAAGTRYYRVEKGDTLYSIARRAKVDLNALAIWNDIAAPYTIFVGQKISLFNSLQAHKPRLQKSSKSSETLPKASGTVQKVRISSQKKLALSIDNRKVLKFYCAWPLKGKVVRSFSQTGNKGIDISAQLGRPVKAAAAGTVVYSGQGLLGYGKLLIIKHNEEFLSAYGNNSKLLVKEGQQVKKGRIIAEAGIGAGNKAALHFEIRKNGEPVNPIDYLPR